MQKVFIACLSGLLMLSGCTASINGVSPAMTSYQGYYTAVEDNDKFIESSLYYHLSSEMSEMPDGTHRYYIFLDQPQIAMYDVMMLAVENDTPYDEADKMMPSIGILDNADYNLIPFQSYTENGYVKGLVISGECTDSNVKLKLLVEWKDKNQERTTREFFSFDLTMDGSVPQNETESGETADPGASNG
ncbi:MAG: hypothetical protein EOM64_02965 [Erysipelotrichia bacterium]|nr:hypothetical protein [Erysipelotrichia bacterium]